MGKQMSAVIDEMGRIEAALAYIPADLSRDEWARIGAVLKHEMGDAGFDLFDAWSQRGESYDAAAARSTWRSLSAGSGITIGTLFHVAVQHGFDARGTGAATVDPAEAERRRAERAERAAKEARERDEKARHAAALAVAVWVKATPASADHPYLTRKGVPPVDTLREIDAGKLAGFDCEAQDAMLDVEDGTCSLILAAFVDKDTAKDGRIANREKHQPMLEG
jgi:putative DNA primase/helicase